MGFGVTAAIDEESYDGEGKDAKGAADDAGDPAAEQEGRDGVI